MSHELRDELMTLLLADMKLRQRHSRGHCIGSLSARGETKLLAELEGLQDGLDVGALARLPYLNAVCSETLRIYPVAIITSLRIAKAPDSGDGL